MADNYAFLKYGKPMAAAAPLLLALNFLPVPAHACTGNDNDPPHCANNNGQPIQNFGAFIIQNLIIVPGSTTVGEEGQFLIPPGADISFNNSVQFGGGVSGGGVRSLPYPDLGDGAGGVPRSDADTGLATEFFGDDIYSYYVTSFDNTPIFVGAPIGAPDDDDLDFSIELNAGDSFYLFDLEGQLPKSFAPIVIAGSEEDFDPETSLEGFSSDCSSFNVPACSAELGRFFIAFDNLVPGENQQAILGALPNDDDLTLGDEFLLKNLPLPGNDVPRNDDADRFGSNTTLPGNDTPLLGLDDVFDANLEFYQINPDDPGASNLRNLYITVNGPGQGGGIAVPEDLARADDTTSSATVPPTINSAPSTSNEERAQATLERNAASLQRLRDEAKNETNPGRKAELERRIENFERFANQFGTIATKSALQSQDNQGAPLPGR